jgi:DNA-binding NtrC family response regulator
VFRRDLYFRLRGHHVHVPPLRERPEDIPLLVWAFVRQFEKKMGKRFDRISQKDMEAIIRYPWPGNARELRNVIEHAMILCGGKNLEIKPPRGAVSEKPAIHSLEDVEREHILGVLRASGWRISGPDSAAEILGLKRTTLQSKMKKLGIRRLSR